MLRGIEPSRALARIGEVPIIERLFRRLKGLPIEQLAPLVLATAHQWAELGPERSLTGAIARGDDVTTRKHRETVQERTPELLPLWDQLAEATRAVAGRRSWTP